MNRRGPHAEETSGGVLEKVGRGLRLIFSTTGIPTVYEVAGQRHVDGATLTGEAEREQLRRAKGKARVEDESGSSPPLAPAGKPALSFKALAHKALGPTLDEALTAVAAGGASPGTPRLGRGAQPHARWSAGSEVELGSMGSGASFDGGSSSSGGSNGQWWEEEAAPGPSSRPAIANMV